VALLQKDFSHPSLVVCFFATPPIKLKLGQQIGGGTTNRKPDHLDQLLWWASQKHWAAVRSNLLHSFMHVHTELLCALPPQPVQLRWAKTISLSQTAVFWHFFIQILVCRITYDHPWRCSYKIVNQACYNMVPNLLVQCKLCDSSTTESQWGSKGRGTCGCVGSHNQTFTSSQLTWNSPNRFGYCFHSAWFHKSS